MPHVIKKLIDDYGWVHTGISLLGNSTFFAGSLLFLPQFEPWKTTGVWLFIVGSFLMLLGTTGRLLVGVLGEG